MNEDNSVNSQIEQLNLIMAKLEHVKQQLIAINTHNGNMARYHAMKDEIMALGWSGICEKYHPDINLDDPAAAELFALYKFIYDTMERD